MIIIINMADHVAVDDDIADMVEVVAEIGADAGSLRICGDDRRKGPQL